MYTWVLPLNHKSGESVNDSFMSILNKEILVMLQSNKGSEYKNAQFQSLHKECGIRFYTSENDGIKAAIIKKCNRTLKPTMYRYFTHQKSFRYVDVLQDLVYSYNHSHHMSIGMEHDMVIPRRMNNVLDAVSPPT